MLVALSQETGKKKKKENVNHKIKEGRKEGRIRVPPLPQNHFEAQQSHLLLNSDNTNEPDPVLQKKSIHRNVFDCVFPENLGKFSP